MDTDKETIALLRGVIERLQNEMRSQQQTYFKTDCERWQKIKGNRKLSARIENLQDELERVTAYKVKYARQLRKLRLKIRVLSV